MRNRHLLISLLVLTYAHTFAQDNILSEEDFNLANESYQKATELFYAKDFQKALPLIRLAIRINEGNSDYWSLRSSTHAALKQLDSALISIAKADELEPNQSDYLLVYANVLYKKKEYTQAVKKYSEALSHQKTSEIPINEGHVYFNRGSCWLRLENYEKAKADFDTAINIGYQVAMVYHNRATALIRLNSRSAACSDFEKATELGSTISGKYTDKYCK